MQLITLYRYIRDDGGTTVSIDQPDCNYTEEVRIISDPGKLVTLDGKELFPCVDVESAEGWYEVDEPIEIENNDMSEIEKKARAYDILMGVSE
jgi:hypothetical protein